MTEAMPRRGERCPACGRYVSPEADGFYSHLPGDVGEFAMPRIYCDEACCNTHHHKMSQEDAEAQRRGFAYGNTRLADERITRQSIARAAISTALGTS